MSNDVWHLFICLFDICITSLVNHIFTFFHSLFFSYYLVNNSLHIQDTGFHKCFTHIIFQSMTCLFMFLTESLVEFCIFDKI